MFFPSGIASVRSKHMRSAETKTQVPGLWGGVFICCSDGNSAQLSNILFYFNNGKVRQAIYFKWMHG